jgi:hypothetical protein
VPGSSLLAPAPSLDGDGATPSDRQDRPVRPHSTAAAQAAAEPPAVARWCARSPPIHRKRNESRGHTRARDPSRTMKPPPNEPPPAGRTYDYERCGGGTTARGLAPAATSSCRHAAPRARHTRRRPAPKRPAKQPKRRRSLGAGRDRRSYWPLSLRERAQKTSPSAY